MLPLVEGVMVDHHTQEKNITIDLSGDIYFLHVLIYITPSTKGSMFIIFNNNAYSRKHEPSLYKNINP
jgi:hypothetical protein